MRRFEIYGVFEAKDIDDALAYLAAHFHEYLDEADADQRLCQIEVRPEPDDAD